MGESIPILPKKDFWIRDWIYCKKNHGLILPTNSQELTSTNFTKDVSIYKTVWRDQIVGSWWWCKHNIFLIFKPIKSLIREHNLTDYFCLGFWSLFYIWIEKEILFIYWFKIKSYRNVGSQKKNQIFFLNLSCE